MSKFDPHLVLLRYLLAKLFVAVETPSLRDTTISMSSESLLQAVPFLLFKNRSPRETASIAGRSSDPACALMM